MFEKKNGKRFLASVMALVMLLSLAPVGALAAGETPTNEECSTMPLPANEADPKPVVTDEENTENTNEEPTPPPRNEGDAVMTADNNVSPFGLSWNTPLKINDISLSKSACENCDVYYYETGSTELKKFNETITHSNQTVPYGIVFFVAPHEGYALTKIIANTRNAEFFSIANDDDISNTDFYTKNSKGSTKTPVRKLLDAGFDETGLRNLVIEAKNQKNCVAAFIYSRSGTNNDNISATLSFYAKKLATLEKKVDYVTRGSEQLNLATQKVRAGDIITYSFTVTYYQGTDSITYKNIRATDSRVTDPQTMEFQGPSGGNTTETKTATYTVTEQDIINAAQNEDKLTNTATLTYTYQAPYNDGAYTVSDTATANVTTVGTVSYQYTGTVPGGVANLPTTASHEKNEQVKVANRPNNITGYTFEGWTAPDGVTVNNGTFTMPDKSITFTGKWIANKYKVTYKDGDTPLDNLSEDVAYGTDVIVKSYSKEGDKLTGWVDGDNRSYSVNDTFTMPDKDVTLTAQWTKTDPPVVPSNLVTAKFFINLGGKDASKPDGTGTFTKDGIEIEDAINFDVFDANRKYGYGNNGYIFNENGVKKQYTDLLKEEPTSEQINEKINENLPADKQNSMSVGGSTGREVVWYHVSDCTKMSNNDGYHVDGYIKNVDIKITYNPNGGIFAGEETSKNHVVDGKSGEVHQIIQDTPARDGYIFNGWKLEGSENIYQPNGSITPTGDVTLVAQWRVTLTYHENFGNTEHTYTISFDEGSTQTVQSYAELRRLYGVFGENTGFYFDEWNTQANGKGKSHPVGSTISMTNSIDLYAQWKQARVPKVAYTINQHFINEKNQEITTLANSQYKSAKQGTVLNTLITKTLKENKKDSENNVYVYIADKTTFKVGTTTVSDTAVLSSKDTVIDLYYYLDKVGETSEKNPNGGPDNIPDAWQYKVTFKVKNGSWNDKTNAAIVKYVTKKDAEGNNSATGTATLSAVPAVGNEPNSGYRTSGSWDKPLSVGLEIKKDTEFTFTYSRRSSSGGNSRPSTPTVTIPDDVPTGLNGKDHYAYIIGYGNNDVRPQNNITRAEVATIFFRLLTDETREANMTKSNGYNDVKDGDWFCCAVSTLSKMGIIKGYEDGSFKPNDPISRAEFAAIAARFDPDGDKTPASFFDVTSHWAKDEISIAANHGWIKGYEDGSFKPDQKITRAETMTLVNRVLNRLPEAKDDLHKDMKTWVDNMDETAWYYLAVQEATNSHYFKNKTGTKFEQWTDLRDTRDWSELEK